MAREEWEGDYIEALERTGGNRSEAARQVRPPIHRNTPLYHYRRNETFRAQVDRVLRRGARAGVLVALLLLAGAAGATTITSAPVQLGAAGLDLAVTLRQWTEAAPDSWPTASTVGITVNDLGDGSYTISGLPLATGTVRYAATLAIDGDAERGLFTYTYGAQPGVRLVWKEDLDLPAAPTTFKQGDTYGSLSLVVRRRLPAAACEPGTTATLTVANAQTGVALFSDRSATISNCELDATTASYGATFTYDIQAGDLATVGKYIGEFEICYEPGVCHTVPTDGRLRFEVVKRLGG
jgi:hypothetical protein